MANSQGPRYTRPADLREMDYIAFEANTLAADGTTVLVAAPETAKSLRVHGITIVNSVADAGGTLSIQSGGGKVLFKMALDVVDVIKLDWGSYPWGYKIDAADTLTAVIAGASATDISIQGYVTL